MITRELVLQSFQTVRNNTIEVARDIPEEQYDFRGAPETRTVRENLIWIVQLTEFMVAVALTPEPIKVTNETRAAVFDAVTHTKLAPTASKAEIIDALATSMARMQQQVGAADLDFLHGTVLAPDGQTKVRLWSVQCAKEQEMAIRAQLMLIERMLGIVPHTTRRQQVASR